jgi:hypothetical protein
MVYLADRVLLTLRVWDGLAQSSVGEVQVDGSAGVPPRDIPRELLEEVREKIWLYTVSVFAVKGARPAYQGTATCVAGSGSAHLLTAAHVWRALGGHRFALSLQDDRLLLPVEKSLVEPRVVDRWESPEWGPDLALLKLPEIIAADIRQWKAFYNLDKRRPNPGESVQTDVGLWAVIGAPAEQSTFAETEAVLRVSAFVSRIVSSWQRDGFDYLDLSFYHKDRPDLPRFYGGLSGSGLWQLPITKSAASGAISWSGEARLEGLAFYQKFTSADEGVIRCHGPTSIYELAFGGVP